MKISQLTYRNVSVLNQWDIFQSISPGYVKTEILEAAALDINGLKVFSSFPALESKDVADAVVYVIETPQRVQITELTITPFGESI